MVVPRLANMREWLVLQDCDLSVPSCNQPQRSPRRRTCSWVWKSLTWWYHVHQCSGGLGHAPWVEQKYEGQQSHCMAIQLLQGLACTYNSWASTVANHSHQFSLKVGCFDSMWLRKQHWDNDLHQILPTHYQYLQYHICKYLLLIHIEILEMDISWFDSVSWITRQLAHSLWASGHLRGDKGAGPGGNKITRFEVSGSFSKKQIMKIVFFLYVFF